MQRAGYKAKECSEAKVQQPSGIEEEQAQIVPQETQIAIITKPFYAQNQGKLIFQNIDEQQQQLVVPASKTKNIKKKDKFKKRSFGSCLIMKNSLQSKQQALINSPEYIFRLIPSNKIFFVAGDILVEVKRKFDPELLNSIIFNEFRNIQSIEQNNLSFCLQIQSIKPMKMLNQVIYELENSQDQDNFNYAQDLRQHQNTILIIQDLIQQVIDSYQENPDDLQTLLKEREAFMLQEKAKLIEKVIQNDEFACIGSLVLSFENKAVTISHISITRPSIELIGGEDEFLIEYFLHKGFWNTYNFNSRRIIFEAYIKSQKMNLTEQTQMEDIPEFVLEVPGFEVCSVDGIHIFCSCTISSKKVIFPQHLQFKNKTSWLLNQIQSFFIVRFHITKEQIEQFLQLRHHQEFNGQTNIKEILEICNLEYDIKSQVFLEKYYKEHCYLLNNKKKEQEMKDKDAIENVEKITCKYVLL